jgi:hypothetical protein
MQLQDGWFGHKSETHGLEWTRLLIMLVNTSFIWSFDSYIRFWFSFECTHYCDQNMFLGVEIYKNLDGN